MQMLHVFRIIYVCPHIPQDKSYDLYLDQMAINEWNGVKLEETCIEINSLKIKISSKLRYAI